MRIDRMVMRFIITAVLISVSVATAFGGGEKDEANDETTIAIVLKTLSNPFWVTMQEGIEAEAERQGVKVDVFAVQSEDDLRGQLQLFSTLLSKNYKGIGFAPLSPVNLVPVVAEAYQKDIFLVNIDEKIDMKELQVAGGNVEAFITTDNEQVGAKAAHFMVEQIGAGGGIVAIIEGKAGAASGEARRRGAAGVFESEQKIELVASQPADWDRSRALDVATNIIQRFPDLRGIYCANDTMALGAMQAVANTGKKDQIVVVGTDGIPEAVDMVEQGRLAATVGQDPAEVGAESLRRIIAAIESGVQISIDATPVFIAVDSNLIK